MKYTIRGDKVVVTKAIKEYIETKLARLERYFDKNEEVTVNALIKVHNKSEKVEITIKTPNFLIRCEEISEDLYKSIDKSIDTLERQINKNKKKIMSKNLRNNSNEIIIDDTYEIEEEDKKIIKRKKFESKPMSEEDAILEMELLEHDFFLFKDSKTFEMKLLYRRKDGNYGIIETL